MCQPPSWKDSVICQMLQIPREAKMGVRCWLCQREGVRGESAQSGQHPVKEEEGQTGETTFGRTSDQSLKRHSDTSTSIPEAREGWWLGE